MTRRLVSMLGMGKDSPPPHYEAVSYDLDGRCSKKTPLVQAALLELAGPFDSVVLLGTKEVRARWVDTGEIGRQGLEGVAPDPEASRRFVEVSSGRTREDLWTLFTAYTSAFGLDSPPSELVFDVTHGFRTQPMIGIAALQFALSEWIRRGVAPPTVRVLYGAFETRQADVAPVWDMTDILLVSRWNGALDALMRYGRADDLESLALAASVEHRASLESEGLRGKELSAANTVKSLGKQARDYADDLALGRLISLHRETVPKLRKLLSSEEIAAWTERLPVLKGTVAELASDLSKLDRAPVAAGPGAPTDNWPLDEEGLVALTHLVEVYERMQRFAEMAALLRESSVVQHALDSARPMKLDRSKGGLDPIYAEEIHSDVERDWSAANRHNAVSQIRNDIEHLGLRKNPLPARALRDRLRKLADAQAKATLARRDTAGVRDLSDLALEAEQKRKRQAVFRNLSNHSVATWASSQRDAARALGYGEPADLTTPLPLVDPAATSDELAKVAEQIVDAVCAEGRPFAAYVGTEPTLTLMLVALLQARGVRCFNATSARDTQESTLDDGSTRSVRTFRFVTWREYAIR